MSGSAWDKTAGASDGTSAMVRAAARAKLPLSQARASALGAFVDLLRKHGRRSNLVGTDDPGRIADEIVLDAVRLAPLVRAHLGDSGTLIDIGAGAGIPSIPLLLVLPGWSAFAVEPRLKRCSFMRAARRELGLGDRLTIVEDRIDSDGSAGEHALTGRFDLAVSKAVFEPSSWRSHATQLARAGGGIGYYLGESSGRPDGLVSVEEYLTDAGARRAVGIEINQ